tara:strand:+ start:188 stop:343 length:156 start_codon:yes stop_codon:yes gene_type:complete
MFSEKIKGLKEWYARFRGRKFYNRVRKVYTRSKEITQERINGERLDGGSNG